VITVPRSEILEKNSGRYIITYCRRGDGVEVTIGHDCSHSLIRCGEWPDTDAAASAVGKVLERIDEEAAAREVSLKSMITVALCGLRGKRGSMAECVVVEYVYENRSSKDVRAFEGKVTYRDVLGNEVDADFKVFTPIKSGQKSSTTDLLPSKAARGLRGARLEDVEIEWNPTKILFVDGTSEPSSFPSAADLVRIAATVQKG
jgi:hypothetical protein